MILLLFLLVVLLDIEPFLAPMLYVSTYRQLCMAVYYREQIHRLCLILELYHLLFVRLYRYLQ